jgi:glycosyltransferase involved in cell wall biosynthesis
MHVWLLQTGETMPIGTDFRPMRTSAVARALLARGHSVTWWTSAFEHQRKTMVFDGDTTVSLAPGFDLRVIRGTGYRRNVSLARYVDHAVVAYKFARQAERAPRPDVIVAALPCHMLAYQAVAFARRNGIPVLIDVRDLWPDVFVDKSPDWAKPVARVLFARDFTRTRRALARADGILAVSQGYLEWGLRNARRRRSAGDAVVFHGYRQPSAEDLRADAAREVPPWLRNREGSRIFAFVGTFGESYELDLVLEVARRLADRKDATFVVAGTGQQAESLARQSAQLSNVALPGWIDGPAIRQLLTRAYAGLVPCRSVSDTLPNKPFEYLASGLPLISSLEGEMPQLVSTYDMGLNYLPGDANALESAVRRLLDDEVTRNRMSANARRFAATEGNADLLYAQYAAHIEAIALAHA